MSTGEIDGSLPHDHVESLATRLRAGPRADRLEALEALVTTGRPQATEAIAETALRAGDLEVRARAAQVLADLRDPRARDGLLDVLDAGWDIAWMSGRGESVRQATARLAKLSDQTVVDRLLELMDARRGQRGPWAQVCKVLGAYRDPRAVVALLDVVGGNGCLSAADKVAAIQAVEAIGYVDSEVASELGFASGKLALPWTDPGAFPESVEVHATNSLLEFIARADDPKHIEVLAEVLSSARNPYVRGEAAAALARFPEDARVISALEQAARTERDNAALRGIVAGLKGVCSGAAAEAARQLDRREAKQRAGNGVLLVVAGLSGLAAAVAGGYFFMLGGSEGLRLALFIWVLAAGPLLGWTAKNVAATPGRQDRGSPHCERDDGFCAHCHQPWPCASERGVLHDYIDW